MPDNVGHQFGDDLIPIQTLIFARLSFLPFCMIRALYSALPYLLLLPVYTVWSQLSWHLQQCFIRFQSWLFKFSGGNPSGFCYQTEKFIKRPSVLNIHKSDLAGILLIRSEHFGDHRGFFAETYSGRGFAWLDNGTHGSLLDADNFVRTLTERQGLQVGSTDEIAYQAGWINRSQLAEQAKLFEKTGYGKYLADLAL